MKFLIQIAPLQQRFNYTGVPRRIVVTTTAVQCFEYLKDCYVNARDDDGWIYILPFIPNGAPRWLTVIT